jgi:ATP-dependent RNA helicase TDRD9
MDSSDEEDLFDAFFKGEMPKKHKIKPQPNLTIVKKVCAKNEISSHKREVNEDLSENRVAEERKILTAFLNAPVEEIDDTLGIAEIEEIPDGKPEYKNIYQKYKFNIARQALPIESKHHQILQTIKTNKITVLKADTGCGKSSQVPQYILEDCQQRNLPCNIVITQPKKISAESLATRVAFERKCKIGSLVGYQVGLDKRMDADDTRILYCTTGVFLQKLVHYKSLQKWTHIIIGKLHIYADSATDCCLFVLIILNNVAMFTVISIPTHIHIL